VTRVVEIGWAPAPPPPGAAPLRAVETYNVERDGDRLRVSARVAVRGDEPNLRGHFPGLPVFPGVFVIEAVCQAVAHTLGTPGARPPVLRAVRSVRFLAPLLDGDELTLELAVTPREGSGWSVRGTGRRLDGTVAAKVSADFDPGQAAGA
jgi:3-hydroxyacyl-[acyl-carrier-protein] dehydratase